MPRLRALVIAIAFSTSVFAELAMPVAAESPIELPANDIPRPDGYESFRFWVGVTSLAMQLVVVGFVVVKCVQKRREKASGSLN